MKFALISFFLLCTSLFAATPVDITAVQTANTVLAGPTSGASAVATFRPLVAADLTVLTLVGDVGGTVGATSIGAGKITDSMVNSAAAIAGSKINPDFGSQNILTSGNVTIQGTLVSGTFTGGGGSLTLFSQVAGSYLVIQPASTLGIGYVYVPPATAGTAGQVLTTQGNGSAQTWTSVVPLTTGTILQVVPDILTVVANVHTTSATPQASGLTAAITAHTTGNKIKIEFTTQASYPGSGENFLMYFYKDGTIIDANHAVQLINYPAGTGIPVTGFFIDSAANTSSHTYAIFYKSTSGGDCIFLNFTGASDKAFMTLTEIAQ